ncbi:pyridoxal phosphate-dependent transferase, partial [Leucosporidium creatinivorum]
MVQVQDYSTSLDLDSPTGQLKQQLALEEGYGYGDVEGFEKQRVTEYPALKETVYLDHAASAPAPPAAVQAFLGDISTTLYSNPHSRSPSSAQTGIAIDRIRSRVLAELFGLSSENSKEWDVVFTAGATASLKLVGDGFRWQEGARFRYLKQSHTSLVGIRGLALAGGAQVEALEAEEMLKGWLREEGRPNLVAYPAQCNATGSRLGLELGRRIKRRSPDTAILLDAAAYLSTSVLDLGSIPLEEAPDFVACSFYKIFGWPTGLGALVVKRFSAHLLNDPYFGGGTVQGLSTDAPFWVSRRRSPGQNPPVHERLEAGTLPFLDIISLGHALDTHLRLYHSHSLVSAHTSSLSRLASHQLSLLRHANGTPVVQQHRFLSLEAPGSTIGFSLLDSAGLHVGHVHLERLATINGFQLRTGGLCNTGAWTSAMGLTDEDLLKLHEKGRACWDDEEFDDLHRPLGIARISFGASSQLSEVLAFIDFIRRFFTETEDAIMLSEPSRPLVQSPIRLERLTVYPIKSCAGQSVSSWEIAPTGLAYDREWMLVDSRTGSALSQKRWPRMVLIHPHIDLSRQTLTITAPEMHDLILPLTPPPTSCSPSSEAQLCGDTVSVTHVSSTADEWFSTFLGTSCELHRFASSSSPDTPSRHGQFDGPPQPLLLSNESPFLLISSSSTRQLNEWIKSETHAPPIQAACFRANFQLSEGEGENAGGVEPFFEDRIDLIRIGGEFFQALGPCRRCLMVSIDQDTGLKTSEPFSTLARKRKSSKCRINFGTHLIWRKDLSKSGKPVVREGDTAVIVSVQ